MELKVEYVNISTIKPYKRNAKTHPKEQIEQIKKSIQEFGNCDPIGVWHGEIVEGHGRSRRFAALHGIQHSRTAGKDMGQGKEVS